MSSPRPKYEEGQRFEAGSSDYCIGGVFFKYLGSSAIPRTDYWKNQLELMDKSEAGVSIDFEYDVSAKSSPSFRISESELERIIAQRRWGKLKELQREAFKQRRKEEQEKKMYERIPVPGGIATGNHKRKPFMTSRDKNPATTHPRQKMPLHAPIS